MLMFLSQLIIKLYKNKFNKVMDAQSHVLKFLIKGKTFPTNVGVTCFPRQTFGVSEEAPEEFKQKHTLIGENGYLYEHDEEQKPISFRQKKYSSVVGNTIDVVENFPRIYEESYNDDSTIFRRRKGRLTEFMDKNGWMNKVCKIMGDERTLQAREASNKDRERRINSLKKKKVFENPKALKPKENFPSLSLFTEKTRVRGKRFSLMKEKQAELKVQRELIPVPDKKMQAEAMTNKMASTMNDKDWRSTMTTIRNRYNRSELTSRANVFSFERNPEIREIEEEKDDLKEWFNSTCNSNANRWKFRKPKKMDTNSEQEIMDD